MKNSTVDYLQEIKRLFKLFVNCSAPFVRKISRISWISLKTHPQIKLTCATESNPSAPLSLAFQELLFAGIVDRSSFGIVAMHLKIAFSRLHRESFRPANFPSNGIFQTLKRFVVMDRPSSPLFLGSWTIRSKKEKQRRRRKPFSSGISPRLNKT